MVSARELAQATSPAPDAAPPPPGGVLAGLLGQAGTLLDSALSNITSSVRNETSNVARNVEATPGAIASMPATAALNETAMNATNALNALGQGFNSFLGNLTTAEQRQPTLAGAAPAPPAPLRSGSAAVVPLATAALGAALLMLTL